MIRIMPSHQLLLDAQKLLNKLVSDLKADRPDSEIVSDLEGMTLADLLRVRRLIDHQLAPSVRALPVEVVDGGLPFGQWLADELDLDYERARRMLTFIEEYGYVADEHGFEPSIPQLASDTKQSTATINRRLADFRIAFPGERNPARLARVLRDALNDQRLWGTVDESLSASIRDVPVVANSTSPGDQDRAVQALEDAANSLNDTAVGPTSLYKFMVARGMEVPRDARMLAATLRDAWRAGRIMRAPNGVYTPLDGSGKTEWDRPLTDYYVAAEQGLPLPGSRSSSGGHF